MTEQISTVANVWFLPPPASPPPAPPAGAAGLGAGAVVKMRDDLCLIFI